jgi:hypothetical protein
MTDTTDAVGAYLNRQTRDTFDVARNARLALNLNPYLASDPGALMSIAQSGQVPFQFADSVAQLGGMQTADRLAKTLTTMSPGAQRAAWNRLRPDQQGALSSVGYMGPDTNTGGLTDFLDPVVGAVGNTLGPVMRGVSNLGLPVLSETMDAMIWLGDRASHFYRTVRVMDTEAQLLAAGGFAVGAALAPLTGGASLATVGTTLATAGIIGAAGVAGGTAAAIAYSPSAWWSAFKYTYDGERAFLPSAQRQADRLLAGDGRLASLAKDIAWSADITDVYDLADHVAGQRGALERGNVLRSIASAAETMAAPGTAEYQRAYQSLLELSGTAEFTEAIKTLVEGKISVGRDAARVVGLQPGDDWYNVVSGSVDALWTISMDPTLALGKANQISKAWRYGVGLGDNAGAEVARIVARSPRVQRVFDVVAESVRTGDFQMLQRNVPEARELFTPLTQYVRDEGIQHFDRDALLTWMTDVDQLKSLMAGQMAVKGESRLILSTLSHTRSTFNKMRSVASDFVFALDDANLDTGVYRWAKKAGVTSEMREATPADLFDMSVYHEAGTHGRDGVANLGEVVAFLPGQLPIGAKSMGAMAASLATKMPPGHSINANSAVEIKSFVDLMGRTLGMSSRNRRMWTDFILTQDNKAMRMNAMAGLVDASLQVGGLHATAEGMALRNELVTKWRQAYGFGDEIMVDGFQRRVGWSPSLHDATEIVAPDHRVLRQMMRRGFVLKNVMGVTDSNAYGSFLNVWKPAVLLRLGFIPRNVGEELVSLLARVSVRDFGQGKAALYHAYRDAGMEAARLSKDPLYAFTPLQAEALRHSVAPGFRRVERMLSNTYGGRPVVNLIERWSSFVDEATRNGLTHFMLPKLDTATDSRWTLGAKAMLQNLAAGNPTSWRRMLNNGVDPMLRDAVDSFIKKHGTAVMRDVSAYNRSIYVSEKFGETAVMKPVIDPVTGEATEKPFVLVGQGVSGVSGERRMVSRMDPAYNSAKHAEQAEVFDDPVYAAALGDAVSRYRDPGLELDYDRATTFVNDAVAIIGDETVPTNMRRLTRELLATNNDIRWNGLREEIARTDDALAEALITLQRAKGDLTLGDLPEIYARRAAIRDARAADRALANNLPIPKPVTVLSPEESAAMVGVAQLDAAHGRWLEALGPGEARWVWGSVGQQMIHGERPLIDSWDELENVVEEGVKRRLYDPIHSDVVRGSVRAHSVDNVPMATPVSDGHSRLFAPVVDPAAYADIRYAYAGMPVDDAVDALTVQWNATARTLHYGSGIGAESVPEPVIRAVFRRLLSTTDTQFANAVAAGANHALPAAIFGVNDPRVARAVGEFFDVAANRTPQRIIAQLDVSSDIATIRAGYNIDGTVPLTWEDHGGQRVWGIDGPMIGDRATIVPASTPLNATATGVQPGHTYEEAIDSYAAKIRTEALARLRRSSPTTATARKDAQIYRRGSGGAYERVGAGERVANREQIYDADGRVVEWGTARHYEHQDPTFAPELTWESVGPMVEDLADETANHTLHIVKRTTGNRRGEGEMVRAYRATPDHIGEIRFGGLPDAVTTERYEELHLSAWQRFVNGSFDKVFSPILESVVRQPMALHYYTNAYRQNLTVAQAMLVDRAQMSAMEAAHDTVIDNLLTHVNDGDSMRMAQAAARSNGDRIPTTPFESRVYLSGQANAADPNDLGILHSMILAGATDARDAAALTRIANRSLEPTVRWGTLADDRTGRRLVGRMEELAGIRYDENTAIGAITGGLTAAERAVFAQHGTEAAPRLLESVAANLGWARETAGQLAVTRAVDNMMPFLDSHELRSQFAEWGRGLMPFWYAEENFLKRITRTITLAPESIRKLQLTYLGMQSAGAIRTDENGQDYFVYPASGVLSDVLEGISRTPGIAQIFQARTDMLLPGYSADIGKPAFSPLVTIPLHAVSFVFPEVQPIERAFVGPQGVNRSVVQQIFPKSVSNLLDIIDSGDESRAYASAMMTSLQMMAANGQIPDNPTPDETDEMWRTARNHARITLISQALIGFVVPGSPQAVATGEPGWQAADLTGIGITDPQALLNDEYRQLVSNLGLDAGTVEYLKAHPMDDPTTFVNPLAFVEGRTETISGAPISPSKETFAHYVDNQDWYSQYDMAGPWLLPEPSNHDFNSEAFTGQLINDLRRYRTPDEFMRAMKFKEGAIGYFAAQDSYQERRDGMPSGRARQALDEVWGLWSAQYRALHPVFADELESSDKRTRRDHIVDELRTAIADPALPQSPHSDAVKEMVTAFNSYDAYRRVLSEDRSAVGVRRVDALKQAWSGWATMFIMEHPSTEALWRSVLQPKSEL